MAEPQDIKLQQSQLKDIEAQLASVEQRMQRLALLKKSIELQLIDPKDAQRFDVFLKKLSNVDTSNIESLRGFISGANDKFDELIQSNKIFSKQSETTLKTFIQTDKQFIGVVSNLVSATKASEKLNSSIKDTNKSIEDSNDLANMFAEGIREAYEIWNDLDTVQDKIVDNLKNMKTEQIDNIKNAFGLNTSYDQFSGKISEITAKLQKSGTVTSNMFQFDYGMIDEFVNNVDTAISGMGQNAEITIDGKQIKGADIYAFLENMSETMGPMISKSLEGHIATAKKTIVSELNETSDVIDAMIADLSAKSLDPNAQILSPEMQGKVTAAWEKISTTANHGLMDMIGNTAIAQGNLNGLNKQLQYITANLDEFGSRTEHIAKGFEPLGRYLDVQVSQLQYMTRDLMPNWLYQTLGLDNAFQNISQNVTEGLSNVAKNIAAGQSPMQALSGFAGSFTSSLVKSIGVIGLITMGVTALWKMMTEASQSAKDLSKEFGVSRSTAVDMYKSILGMTSAIENTSLKQEDVLEVLKKHRDEYGLIMDMNSKANQEAIKFSAELGKQYGIGAGEAYGFTEQLQRLGADAAASQEIAAVAAHASDLAGIPFNTITKDLAEASEFVAIQFAGYPLKAVEAATKLRAMGTSLKSVEKAMEKAFDTKNFIQGMTELNIMTRGVVDLSEMFRKSMAGDSVGAAKEMTKQFDKMVASGQMNQFQMRQFAQVTGQSADELLRGNKIRRMDAQLGKDNVDLLGKYLDKLSDADVADAKSAMKAAKRLGAAEKLDSIWASIKDTLIEALMPALESISDLISAIAPVLKVIGILFKGIGIVVKGLAAPFSVVYDLISGIGDLWNGVTPKFERTTGLFGDWGSALSVVKNIASILVGLWASKKMLGSIGKIRDMFRGTRDEQGELVKGSMTLTDRFNGMFKGVKGGGTILEKIKGGVKGLFGKTAESTTPEAPTGKEAEKSLLDKGIDKVKGMFGLGPKDQETADPLQLSADALKEAADELKAAANALSQSGGSALDIGRRGRKGGRRGGRGGGRRGATGRQQGTTRRTGSSRTPKAPKTTTPKVTTPATSTASKAGTMLDKAKSGGKNLLSKGKDLVKPGNLMKGIKSISPAGLASAVAGIGTGMIADKYEAKAMETGDKGDLNIARAAKVGGRALEGAGYGAMIGSVIPGIGTAVGGAVGGVIGGAVGVWENFFSDDAKRQNEQLKQMQSSNKILNGLNDLTEAEMDQLKTAGYSDDLIKKISEGNISLEGAIKEQFSEFNLSEDQLKKLADPKTTSAERDEIMANAEPAAKSSSWISDTMKSIGDALGNMIMPGTYTAAKTLTSLDVGTNLVKSDGTAMLHKGEAVVPADVVSGGFNLPGGSIPIPLPVKIVSGSVDSDNKGLFQKVIGKLTGSNETPETVANAPTQSAFKKPENVAPVSKPVSNEMANLEKPVTPTDATTSYNGSPMQPKSSTNQDALLKQLMSIMQDVANRPVQVEIGGVELRSLNRKMKVHNNKS